MAARHQFFHFGHQGLLAPPLLVLQFFIFLHQPVYYYIFPADTREQVRDLSLHLVDGLVQPLLQLLHVFLVSGDVPLVLLFALLELRRALLHLLQLHLGLLLGPLPHLRHPCQSIP